jgi:Rrf2 family protein
MRISTRLRYGLRALVEITRNPDNGRMTTGAIAARLAVSPKYLGAILARLKEGGLLISMRGTAGGFVMGKDPSSVTVEEVYRILEGPTLFVECVNHPEWCDRSSSCVTRKLWKDLEAVIGQELAGVTLEQLARRQCAPGHRG